MVGCGSQTFHFWADFLFPHNKANTHFFKGALINNLLWLVFSRSKLLSYRNVEDLETRQTLTTTRRNRSVFREQRNAPRNLRSFRICLSATNIQKKKDSTSRPDLFVTCVSMIPIFYKQTHTHISIERAVLLNLKPFENFR